MLIGFKRKLVNCYKNINYTFITNNVHCRGSNMGLWKELVIIVNKHYRLHPITEETSYIPSPSVPNKLPYEKPLSKQNDILSKIIETFSGIKCILIPYSSNFSERHNHIKSVIERFILSLKNIICYSVYHCLNQNCLNIFFLRSKQKVAFTIILHLKWST